LLVLVVIGLRKVSKVARGARECGAEGFPNEKQAKFGSRHIQKSPAIRYSFIFSGLGRASAMRHFIPFEPFKKV
jgi:hypothetical protein